MNRRSRPLALRRPTPTPSASPAPAAQLAPPPGLPLSHWARSALGFSPDPLQAQILDSPSHRLQLLCSRQFGKSTLAAIKALHFALSQPNSTVLCVSPTLRRSTEWLRLLKNFFSILATPGPAATASGSLPGAPSLPGPHHRPSLAAVTDLPHRSHPRHCPPQACGLTLVPPPRAHATAHSLTLPNHSRILALPGAAHSNRGYSAHLLLFEEAAFIPDPVFTALAPSVAATAGALWLISSAGEPAGFFYELWSNPDPRWTRFQITAAQCPRISPALLAEARRALGQKQFQREYFCQFAPDALEWFPRQLLDSALDDQLEPWLLDAA